MSILKKSLGAIGVKVEEDQDQLKIEQTRERHQQLINIYWWLRTQLDEAIAHYFRSNDQDLSAIESVCQKQALAAVTKQLTEYHNQDITWHMPNRRQRTEPKIIVVEEKGNTFICEEKFLDFSILQKHENGEITSEKKNNGQPVASRARIEHDGEFYWFSELYMIPLEG